MITERNYLVGRQQYVQHYLSPIAPNVIVEYEAVPECGFI
jgi:hypothetical protein